MVSINSKLCIIPKDSLIEINQISLLNDTAIDIWPLKSINILPDNNKYMIDHLSCV